MSEEEIVPLRGREIPRLAVPLSILKRSRPEEAERLIDRLYETAERKYGEWPAFEFEKNSRLLYAKPREDPPPHRYNAT